MFFITLLNDHCPLFFNLFFFCRSLLLLLFNNTGSQLCFPLVFFHTEQTSHADRFCFFKSLTPKQLFDRTWYPHLQLF